MSEQSMIDLEKETGLSRPFPTVESIEDVPERTVPIETQPVIPEPMDPVEEAAMRFTQLLPFVAKIASASQSQKGLVRVLHALAEFPLGKTKPRLLNDNERQLFSIIQELNGYKSTVISNIIKQNAATQAPELPVTDSEVIIVND